MKAVSKPTKNPRGGLTAAGRAEFRRKQGAHLKPGVRKPKSAMSLEEKRRKGSWATRFYGRSGKLPPLRGKDGRPTRFALTAAAWGSLFPGPSPPPARVLRKAGASLWNTNVSGSGVQTPGRG